MQTSLSALPDCAGLRGSFESFKRTWWRKTFVSRSRREHGISLLGDPDFFNGIGHAVAVVRALHDEFPNLSYDVTIKIEHLLKHAEHIATLKETGCAFVTSAVESVDDQTLKVLDKGHTREDFIRAVALCRDADLPLAPTFVTFTPWLNLAGFRDLLQLIADLDLVSAVSPVQWAIRLLIPNGSLLLDLPEVRSVIKGFDETCT